MRLRLSIQKVPKTATLATCMLFAVLAVASGCATSVDYRGYQARAGDLQQVQPGMSKGEVEGLLGSPSTTATINSSGDSYYYISSVVQQRAFLDPQEIDRKVFAIRFNELDQVESLAYYGIEDGQIVNYNDRTTPTRGRELSVLQQIFSNIGRFSPNDSGPPGMGKVGQ